MGACGGGQRLLHPWKIDPNDLHTHWQGLPDHVGDDTEASVYKGVAYLSRLPYFGAIWRDRCFG